ncbi:MAG: hypothetical protein ABUL67_01180 [Haliangium ochraceum]
MTTRISLLAGWLILAGVLGVSGCGPLVPLSPTWKDDIRPLVVARCVRCHDDPPRGDPASKQPATPSAAFTFNYPSDVVLDPLPVGLSILKLQGGDSVRGKLAPLRRMPPPPAEALEDWQIEMLDNWAYKPR